MIQITEEKKEKLTDMCEKMLHYGGKIMQCLESLDDEECEAEMGMRDPYDDEEEMGMRGRMGMRGGMGHREGGMGYRRGRDSMGRYSRY